MRCLLLLLALLPVAAFAQQPWLYTPDPQTLMPYARQADGHTLLFSGGSADVLDVHAGQGVLQYRYRFKRDNGFLHGFQLGAQVGVYHHTDPYVWDVGRNYVLLSPEIAKTFHFTNQSRLTLTVTAPFGFESGQDNMLWQLPSTHLRLELPYVMLQGGFNAPFQLVSYPFDFVELSANDYLPMFEADYQAYAQAAYTGEKWYAGLGWRLWDVFTDIYNNGNNQHWGSLIAGVNFDKWSLETATHLLLQERFQFFDGAVYGSEPFDWTGDYRRIETEVTGTYAISDRLSVLAKLQYFQRRMIARYPSGNPFFPGYPIIEPQDPTLATLIGLSYHF